MSTQLDRRCRSTTAQWADMTQSFIPITERARPSELKKKVEGWYVERGHRGSLEEKEEDLKDPPESL